MTVLVDLAIFMVDTQEERKNPNFFRYPSAKRERGTSMADFLNDDVENSPNEGVELDDKTIDLSEPSTKSEFTALEDIIDGELGDDDDAPDVEEQEGDSAEPSEDQAQTSPEVAEPGDDGRQPQTPEQNAYFAELRRQREAQQRAFEEQQRIEALRQQMPEVQLANMLAQEYGVTPEVMLQRIQQERIAKEAQQRGITPQQLMFERQQQEFAMRQQQMLQQQQQLLQVQSLVSRLEREGMEVRSKYPTLTPDDLTEAVIYGHQNNALHLPLESLVRMRHADKLYAVDANTMRQEALAQVSGRMTSGIKPPQGKAPSSATTLNETEAYFAKKLGIRPEDYAKYK